MYKSDPASPYPDTQAFFTPLSASGADPTNGRMLVDKFSGAMFVAYMMYPTSRGSIHITGPGTKDKPRLVPNFLSTEHDRGLAVQVYEKAREILATGPLAQLVDAEVIPGERLQGEEILRYQLTKSHGFHTVGTCMIGTSDDSVVDDRLRVRGTTKLRVVDASVFPSQPAGNNNAGTQAMAWIAADVILDDQ
jgi:choline dehydrogenase